MTEPKTTLPILCLWILHLGLISQAILGRFGYQSLKMHVGQLLCVFKLAARIKSSEIHNFSRKQKHTDIYIYTNRCSALKKVYSKTYPYVLLIEGVDFQQRLPFQHSAITFFYSNLHQSIWFLDAPDHATRCPNKFLPQTEMKQTRDISIHSLLVVKVGCFQSVLGIWEDLSFGGVGLRMISKPPTLTH